MNRARASFAAVAVSAALVASPPVGAQSDSACPLPLDRQIDAIDAFSPIASFLTSEPRCFNCHGGVNPHIDGTGADPEDVDAPLSLSAHGGGRILRQRETAPDGTALIQSECRDCHNDLPRRSDGGPSLWMTAPSFLSFVGKDAPTLCKQIKRATGTAEHFLGHLEDDNGGHQFGRAAFAGRRGLDPDRYDIRAEPPSVPHSELMRIARQWVDAMDGRFQGDESCGCEVELEGTFSQSHTSALTAGIGTIAQNYTINGRLVWRPQDTDEQNLPMLPSFGPDTPSSFLRPSAGEITVEIDHESRGIGGGVCTVAGSRTFRVEQMPEEARQHLWLELAEDGRYKLSLGVISRYLLTPVEVVCRVAGRDVRSTERWDTAVMIGLQQGTVGENGVAGRLEPPLRLGAATITGEWSFGTGR